MGCFFTVRVSESDQRHYGAGTPPPHGPPPHGPQYYGPPPNGPHHYGPPPHGPGRW